MANELEDLGLTEELAEAILAIPEAQAARIFRLHRNHARALGADGEIEATVPGKLHHHGTPPAVGDWVAITGANGSFTVAEVLPRRTAITRLAAGRAADVQIVAANVDVAFIVTGVDGDFNVRRLERYATQIAAGGATPIVVLNKIDLVESAERFLEDVNAVLPNLAVCAVSTVTEPGVDALRAFIGRGTTAVLLGSSGVGKSSITNALLGEDVLAVGEVRDRDDRGTHTTSHRELFLLPSGGLIMDTPGLREVKMLAEEADLNLTFDDVIELSHQCRFRDCAHGQEPGCAVAEALRSGQLATARFEAYNKLRAEIASNELRADAHAKRAEDKRLHRTYRRAAAAKRRRKDGE